MRATAVLVLVLSGCGTDGDALDGGDLGAASDGGDDLAVYVPSHDAGPLVCGMAGVCGAADTCCVETPPDGGAVPDCTASCTNGFPVRCAGPGYCGGLPCCITLNKTRPQDVSCSAQATDCVPNINIMGNGVTRVCDQDGDCTAGAPGTMFDQCCHLTSNGYKICFSSVYVGITKGAIACP